MRIWTSTRDMRNPIGHAMYNPWHPLVHLALAGFEKDPVRADFLRHYSLDRLPNDPKLRQRAAELLRTQVKEDLTRKLRSWRVFRQGGRHVALGKSSSLP